MASMESGGLVGQQFLQRHQVALPAGDGLPQPRLHLLHVPLAPAGPAVPAPPLPGEQESPAASQRAQQRVRVRAQVSGRAATRAAAPEVPRGEEGSLALKTALENGNKLCQGLEGQSLQVIRIKDKKYLEDRRVSDRYFFSARNVMLKKRHFICN